MQCGRAYLVRPVDYDGPFLRDMLYEAIYTPPGHARPEQAIIDTSALAKYVAGWGKADDVGFLAATIPPHRSLGAAWLRLLTQPDSGYGYVDDETPELVIAVTPEYRGRGIGTVLLRQLLERAAGRYPAVSLSVDPRNHALALYQRFGFRIAGTAGMSLTLCRDLTNLGRWRTIVSGRRGS